MGCDIHWIVEGRRKDTGAWEWPDWDRATFDDEGSRDYSVSRELIGERNYSLFYLLAGVRRWHESYGPDPTPLFPGRGIPKDSCMCPRHEREQPPTVLGDHSYTFITASDWKLLDESTRGMIARVDSHFFRFADTILSDFCWPFKHPSNHPGYSELRLVIGFDS